MTPPPTKELFIWWTSDRECHEIGPQAAAKLPEYVRVQYQQRFGRAGRGRLWSDPRFQEPEIAAWPKTNIAQMLEAGHGGIVFLGKDLGLFTDDVRGLVTDFRLRMMVVT